MPKQPVPDCYHESNTEIVPNMADLSNGARYQSREITSRFVSECNEAGDGQRLGKIMMVVGCG